MIGRAIGILQRRGLSVLVRASLTRLQGILASQAKSFRTYEHLFSGKTGLEIGGPSTVFAKNGIFPVYSVVQCLDNWNYSNITAWNTDVKPMDEYKFDSKKQYGRQYIGEATSMRMLAANVYDFILSSHMLEHTECNGFVHRCVIGGNQFTGRVALCSYAVEQGWEVLGSVAGT